MDFKYSWRSHGWLIAINSIISTLIACRYYEFLPEYPTDILGYIFIIVTTFSHMALLSIFVGAILLPCLFLPGNIKRVIQSGFFAVFLLLIFIDTIVFAQYRFHINGVVLELILSGQVVSFSAITWITVIFSTAALWLLQWYLILFLDKKSSIINRKFIRYYALLTITTLLSSHLIHIWSAAHAYHSVTQIKRYLPLFHPATATSTMKKIGWINEDEIKKQNLLSLNKKRNVQYPLEKMEKINISTPPNIVFIIIDSWRFDTFTKDNTPNLWRFSQQGAIFNHHLSTGNATRSGIFGLFYGLPPTYWDSFLLNRISPLLMDRMIELEYQIGIFGSAHLRTPEFNKTVFINVPNLREESKGSTPSERDLAITQEWIKWHKNSDPIKPKFSFLFYDSAHGYDYPKEYPMIYEPSLNDVNYMALSNKTNPEPFFNRYKNSVHYIDSLTKGILDLLQSELHNTLVIITGDHSQEMNDNQQNYWGHGSNFTYAQVHVPFAMIGAKVHQLNFKETNNFSDHLNLAPTLLQEYLGVKNQPNDYSTGRNIFTDTPQRPWVLAGNFNGYALIDSERIFEVNISGQSEMLDRFNRPLKNIRPNHLQIQEAVEMMSRFNR